MSEKSKKFRPKPIILLIEDEGLLTRMYSKKLEVDGFEVATAENGNEGIEKAKEIQPDLIVCDVMMPEKDGLSTLQDLKTDEETKDILVIMLSNVADENYVEEALELGAVSYLIKSQHTPAEVVAEIKEKLEAAGKKRMIKT